MKARKKNNALIFLGIAITILLLCIFLIAANAASNVIEHLDMNASLNVGDYMGFKLDNDKIYFGTIPSGSYSKRSISVKSDYEGFIYITIGSPLNEWVFASEFQDFYINAGENKTIELYAYPVDAEQGTYESYVGIYILKREPSNLDKILMKWDEIKYIDPAEITSPRVSINVVRPDED